jgi:hypothetical protein
MPPCFEKFYFELIYYVSLELYNEIDTLFYEQKISEKISDLKIKIIESYELERS